MTPAEREASLARIAAMSAKQRAELACAAVLVHAELIKADAGTLLGYLDRTGRAGRGTDARRVLDLAGQAADAAARAARDVDALAALLLVADARAYLLHVAGECIGLSLGRVRSDAARAAANKRHAPTRDAKALALSWWAQHRADPRPRGGKGTLTKEEAADVIVAMRLVSEGRTTVRKWLRGA